MFRFSTLMVLALTACDGNKDVVDSDDPDSGTDSEWEDTDPGIEPVWRDVSVETSASFNAVYTGGSGAWVAGNSGNAWRIQSGSGSPLNTQTQEHLLGIWGAGDGDNVNLMMVGYAGVVIEYTTQSGSDLTDIGTANNFDVDGVGGDLTAVGRAGVYRYNGSDWSFEDNPVTDAALNGIHVVGDEAWAVGENGTIVHRVADVWSEVASGLTEDLQSVHGITSNNIWVVGKKGTAAHYDGTAWTSFPLGVDTNLWGVWVAPGGVPYAVGNNGLAVRYDADLDNGEDEPVGGWVELPTAQSGVIYAVHGTSEGNIWAVGSQGMVLKFEGN